jgi:hypothetical protein
VSKIFTLEDAVIPAEVQQQKENNSQPLDYYNTSSESGTSAFFNLQIEMNPDSDPDKSRPDQQLCLK